MDAGAASVWALVGAIVLYLSIDGGGYDIVVRSQVGEVVWWVVLVGAAWGVLPAGRLSRAGWSALALFGGFVAWTAIASTWSQSSERSLEELSRVACYLGILLLALAVHRDRERALRHTVGAIASAIVVVAALAVLSRLRPDLFPAAQQTGAYLPGAQGRLGWPLNYWNALAAMVAFGLPLLLGLATSARTLLARAAAAGAIPILALCGYLTFSRGGAIAAAVALIVFIALAPDRIPKVLTVLVAGAGSAVLIAGAVHRGAIENGLADAAARHQGSTLLVAVILVCAGVTLVQAGIELAVIHGTPPRLLVIPRRRAQVLLGVAIMVGLVAALVVGVPSRLSHAWHDFKNPPAAILHQDSFGRFFSVSGNGRYDYWKAAVNATTSGGHALGGSGPGTFQLLWLPRAPFESYVANAHSLYVETFSDVGIVGLTLLVAFLVLVIACAIAGVVSFRYESRTKAAAASAALIAFCVSAAFDWIWQVPALPAAFLVLASAVLAPRVQVTAGARRAPLTLRLGAVALAAAALIAIAIPLATTNAVRDSQSASTTGNQSLALSDAFAAARVEPGAASPQIQAALVQELRGDPQAGVVSARRAVADEPANWSTWLILARLEAETAQPKAALKDFLRARSLNPQSALFKQ